MMCEGTIAGATILAALSSVKSQTRAHDPVMHPTKKGKQWHFGIKARIGVDAESGLVHTVLGTARRSPHVLVSRLAAASARLDVH